MVDRRGLILTNFHVLGDRNDSRFFVTTVDRQRFPARIKAADERIDLAVLEIVGTVNLKPIEFDLNVDDETGEIQLVTDAWTIGIEAQPGSPTAWVAIDAEPEHPNEFDHAIHDAFRPHELAALSRADESLNGLLTRALRNSDDPFSRRFAESLTTAE